MQTPNEKVQWSLGAKLAFRFLIIFFVFIQFPFQLEEFPFLDFIVSAYSKFWVLFVFWVGRHILHIGYPFSTIPNGSGDRTCDYIFLFTTVVAAFVTSAVWSWADRKRNNDNRIYRWFMVYARYYLAFTMFGYGFSKVFPTQFPPLAPGHLADTYGNSSPMGLLWTFMGYSAGYNIFTGLAEIIGGALLLSRRTTVLGTLITIAVMSNVVALNFFYDVPVKLFALQLLLFAFFILWKDAQRLMHFFVFNKPVEPIAIEPYFENKKMNYAQRAVKFLLIGYVIYSNILTASAGNKENTEHPFLYGLYRVECFVRNNDTLPSLTTDTARWSMLTVNHKDFATISLMTEDKEYLGFKPDTFRKTIVVYLLADTTGKSVLHYYQPDTGTLVLKGKFKEDSIVVTLKKADINKYPLINRRFHWINEYPANY